MTNNQKMPVKTPREYLLKLYGQALSYNPQWTSEELNKALNKDINKCLAQLEEHYKLLPINERELWGIYKSVYYSAETEQHLDVMTLFIREIAKKFGKVKDKPFEPIDEIKNKFNAFINKQKDIPQEYAKLINENFWDLLTTPHKSKEVR